MPIILVKLEISQGGGLDESHESMASDLPTF